MNNLIGKTGWLKVIVSRKPNYENALLVKVKIRGISKQGKRVLITPMPNLHSRNSAWVKTDSVQIDE